MASPTISSMTAFSGADLVVSFANQVIGELQGISWGVKKKVLSRLWAPVKPC